LNGFIIEHRHCELSWIVDDDEFLTGYVVSLESPAEDSDSEEHETEEAILTSTGSEPLLLPGQNVEEDAVSIAQVPNRSMSNGAVFQESFSAAENNSGPPELRRFIEIALSSSL